MGFGILVTVILFSVALVFYEPMNSSEKELDEPVAEETIEEETTKEETEEVSDESKDVSEKSEETEKAGGKSEGTSEETSEETDNIKTEETNTTGTETAETKTTDTNTKTPGNSVAFKISAGESSYKVAENLYRAGLIDNPGEFNTYLEQNGYDNTIHVGTFNIPEGSTYDQIANTISK